MAKTVEGVYSEALFALAQEKGILSSMLEETEELSAVLKGHKELADFVSHPRITREEKLESLKAVFEGRLSEELMGFLKLLVEKERAGKLYTILQSFAVKAREELRIGLVRVNSAAPLSEEQRKALQEKLLATTDYRSLEMEYSVDPKLIGGMIVSIGDRVVDNTLLTKLQSLEKELLWKARMDYLRTA